MLQKQTKSHNFVQSDYDVAVIGAGINGAVAAAAASAAGLRVRLVDKGDFANFTSQESSNLVWGGIKYLQTYEFGLVLKLCQARNRLIRVEVMVVLLVLLIELSKAALRWTEAV